MHLSKGNQIILKPIGGLCNRLRSMASAIQLSQDIDKPLIVYWVKARGLNSKFYELFKPINNIEIIETNNLSIFFRYGVYRGWSFSFLTRDLLKCDYYNNKVIVNLINLKIDIKKQIKVNTFFAETCEYFYPSESMFSLFQPIDSIQDKIDEIARKFDNYTIGVHIRRKDHKLAIENSPVELFEKMMKKEIQNEPKTNFYLASDCEKTKAYLKDVFKERIILNLGSTSRLTTNGMQNAVIDLFLLSKTSIIFSSYWSSFSFVAAKITGIKDFTITKDTIIRLNKN